MAQERGDGRRTVRHISISRKETGCRSISAARSVRISSRYLLDREAGEELVGARVLHHEGSCTDIARSAKRSRSVTITVAVGFDRNPGVDVGTAGGIDGPEEHFIGSGARRRTA